MFSGQGARNRENDCNFAKFHPIFKLFFSLESWQPHLHGHTVAGGPGREADWSLLQRKRLSVSDGFGEGFNGSRRRWIMVKLWDVVRLVWK